MLRFAVSIIFGIGVVTSAKAQFQSDVPLVAVRTAVLDRQGRSVAGLAQGSFSLFEDGKRQQLIEVNKDDAPVLVGVLLDRETMCPVTWEQAKSVALTLVESLQHKDSIFVSGFGNPSAQEIVPDQNTDSFGEIINQVRSVPGTSIEKALNVGVQMLSKERSTGRMALIVVTDAEQISGEISEAFEQQITLADGTVYVIALGHSSHRSRWNKRQSGLRSLVQDTGGAAYFPDFTFNCSDAVARQLAADLHSGYNLLYSPPNGLDGKYHQLRVEVQSPGAVQARCRKGYYGRANRRSS
jgi:VWFA-related protein